MSPLRQPALRLVRRLLALECLGVNYGGAAVTLTRAPPYRATPIVEAQR